jgi:hypothetical protein
LGSADIIKRTQAQDNKQEDVTKKYNFKKLFHNFEKLTAKSETSPEVLFYLQICREADEDLLRGLGKRPLSQHLHKSK